MTLLDRYRETAEPLRTERRVELVGLVLAGLLLLQVLWVLLRAVLPSTIDPVYPASSSLQVADILALNSVGQNESAEIRTRPLFWAARRPQEEVPIEEEAPEPKKAGGLPGIKLLGVFGSGDHQGIIAVVKGKQQRLLLGDDVSGWSLGAIEPDRAVFESGGRREEVPLKRNMTITAEAVNPSGGSAANPAAEPAAPAGKSPKPAPEAPATLGLGGRAVTK
ncbi:type II secretion system protein N [Parahaliea mediterranea]|uniref:type II secretion system protein N n=1 Tax=Parahaliea mediterranea TaxID=651086 RepID=UPI000E2F295E|nr:type II secretion system protein N [Parahaliea mediterranea]